MMQNVLELAVAALLLFGIFLYFVNYRWFQRYANLLLGLFTIALAVVIAIVKLLPNVVSGLIKGIFIFVIMLLKTTIYLFTSFVPVVGKRASPLYDYVDKKLHSSGLVNRITIMREMMVDIIAEHDERSLQFDSEEEYREELQRVRLEAETRLNRGESVLSLSLGMVLLLTHLLGIQLFRLTIYDMPASIIIEIYVLLIAVSIIYRVSVLEYLTYTTDAQFSSIQKIDVALSYQKGVCFTNVVQVLMPVLVVSSALFNVDRDLIKEVMEKKYSENLGIFGWVTFAWSGVRNQQ